jgi:hypothetical protein
LGHIFTTWWLFYYLSSLMIYGDLIMLFSSGFCIPSISFRFRSRGGRHTISVLFFRHTLSVLFFRAYAWPFHLLWLLYCAILQSICLTISICSGWSINLLCLTC